MNGKTKFIKTYGVSMKQGITEPNPDPKYRKSNYILTYGVPMRQGTTDIEDITEPEPDQKYTEQDDKIYRIMKKKTYINK